MMAEQWYTTNGWGLEICPATIERFTRKSVWVKVVGRDGQESLQKREIEGSYFPTLADAVRCVRRRLQASIDEAADVVESRRDRLISFETRMNDLDAEGK